MAVLAIEESNHGGIPEVYVGVRTEDPKDLERSQKNLKKANSNVDVSDIIDVVRYDHLVLPGKVSGVRAYEMKIFALAKIIEKAREAQKLAMEKDDHEPKLTTRIERVIIDGELRESDKRDLQYLLGEHKLPVDSMLPIFAIPRADESYPLVNNAHRLARFLFRHYSNVLDGKIHIDDYSEVIRATVHSSRYLENLAFMQMSEIRNFQKRLASKERLGLEPEQEDGSKSRKPRFVNYGHAERARENRKR